MMPGRKEIYDHSRCDERRAEPQGQAVRLRWRSALADLEFLQKQTESGHHKTESH